jgi:hypothetical protein
VPAWAAAALRVPFRFRQEEAVEAVEVEALRDTAAESAWAEDPEADPEEEGGAAVVAADARSASTQAAAVEAVHPSWPGTKPFNL